MRRSTLGRARGRRRGRGRSRRPRPPRRARAARPSPASSSAPSVSALHHAAGRQGGQRLVQVEDTQADPREHAGVAWPLGREEGQLAAPRVGADQRELLGPVDDVHPGVRGQEVGEPVAVGRPRAPRDRESRSSSAGAYPSPVRVERRVRLTHSGQPRAGGVESPRPQPEEVQPDAHLRRHRSSRPALHPLSRAHAARRGERIRPRLDLRLPHPLARRLSAADAAGDPDGDSSSSDIASRTPGRGSRRSPPARTRPCTPCRAGARSWGSAAGTPPGV